MASRPPPPEPYETWLDWILCDYCDFTCTDSRNKVETAKAELAELRADDETLKLQNAVLRAEIERLKAEPQTCLVCGVIMHEPTPDPADEYLRTARAAIDAAKGTK